MQVSVGLPPGNLARTTVNFSSTDKPKPTKLDFTMKPTQFAERQYETIFHHELCSGGSGPFVPTQPLEMYLGIDAATNPRDAHRIWRILKVNLPRRVLLSPALWPSLPQRYHPAISGRFVSLFLQFKVPKFNDSKKAKYRSQFGSPYFEVAITRHQQSRLAELQQRVQSRAIVRYASPAFWTRTDFDRIAAQKRMLAQSAYLIPSRVGTHKKWMYVGSSGKVILNPNPEEIEFEAWQTITELMEKQAREESLFTHVARLADSIRETQYQSTSKGEPAWLSTIREYVKLSPDDEKRLIDIRTVVDAAEQADTTWAVMLFLDDNSRRQFDRFREEIEMHCPPYWF